MIISNVEIINSNLCPAYKCYVDFYVSSPCITSIFSYFGQSVGQTVHAKFFLSVLDFRTIWKNSGVFMEVSTILYSPFLIETFEGFFEKIRILVRRNARMKFYKQFRWSVLKGWSWNS